MKRHAEHGGEASGVAVNDKIHPKFDENVVRSSPLRTLVAILQTNFDGHWLIKFGRHAGVEGLTNRLDFDRRDHILMVMRDDNHIGATHVRMILGW